MLGICSLSRGVRKAFKPPFTGHLTHSEIPVYVNRMDWRSPQDKQKKLEYILLYTLTSPLERTRKTRLVTCKINLNLKKKKFCEKS